MNKKFSWFSVTLSSGVAAPIVWGVTWVLGVLDMEMMLGQLGAVILTNIIMEKLWPTVIRADKEL